MNSLQPVPPLSKYNHETCCTRYALATRQYSVADCLLVTLIHSNQHRTHAVIGTTPLNPLLTSRSTSLDLVLTCGSLYTYPRSMGCHTLQTEAESAILSTSLNLTTPTHKRVSSLTQTTVTNTRTGSQYPVHDRTVSYAHKNKRLPSSKWRLSTHPRLTYAICILRVTHSPHPFLLTYKLSPSKQSRKLFLKVLELFLASANWSTRKRLCGRWCNLSRSLTLHDTRDRTSSQGLGCIEGYWSWRDFSTQAEGYFREYSSFTDKPFQPIYH